MSNKKIAEVLRKHFKKNLILIGEKHLLDELRISVMNTTKTNTSPKYKNCYGEKVIYIHTSSFMSVQVIPEKDKHYFFNKNRYLFKFDVFSYFIKEYKKHVLREIQDETN